MVKKYSIRDVYIAIRQHYDGDSANDAFKYLNGITKGTGKINDSGLKSAVTILAETDSRLSNLGQYDFDGVIRDLKHSRRNIRLIVGFTVFTILATTLAYRWGCAKPKEQDIGQKAQQYLQGVIDERVQHTEEGIQVDLNGSSDFDDKLIKFKKAYEENYGDISAEEKKVIKKKAGAILKLYTSPKPENQEKAEQMLEDLLKEFEKKGIKLEN